MNRKLAETDTGRMKQLENNLGDIKEQIGGILKKADTFITMGANDKFEVWGMPFYTKSQERIFDEAFSDALIK